MKRKFYFYRIGTARTTHQVSTLRLSRVCTTATLVDGLVNSSPQYSLQPPASPFKTALSYTATVEPLRPLQLFPAPLQPSPRPFKIALSYPATVQAQRPLSPFPAPLQPPHSRSRTALSNPATVQAHRPWLNFVGSSKTLQFDICGHERTKQREPSYNVTQTC